jgi:hypothetical protein
MPSVTVHVGTSVNYGPIALYSHFVAPGSPLNVLDTTSAMTVDVGSRTEVRVGMLPTTDGTASRTVFVDGLTELAVGSVTVNLHAFGSQLGTFQALVPANTAPAAADLSGASPSAEYPTPTSR